MSAEARAGTAPPDLVVALDGARRATLATLADHLIPGAHGMPSAGGVVGDTRLRFVLGVRPDLIEPLRAALRAELPDDPTARLAALELEEPEALAALALVIVGAYYTDKVVRERLGYSGQRAIQVQSWKYPQYLEEGLIDEVLARGPIWRDPSTGRTAVADRPMPATTTDRGA
jgi:hypothetical protein